MESRSEIAAVKAEIKRIGDLAAERGVELPRIRADIKRIEDEMVRMRDHLERIEQNQRGAGPRP
jgi:predicted  nucleic acid-binding Zn-ribbon protein